MARAFPTGNRWQMTPMNLTAYPVTLSCFGYNPGVNTGTLLGIGSAINASSHRIALATGGAASLTTRSNGSSQSATTVNTVASATWHHICGVFASNTDKRIYLNADDANKGSNTNSIVWNASLTENWSFGSAWESGAISNVAPNNARIAQAAAWAASLTLEEIEALSEGFDPRLIRPNDLVLYVPAVREIIDYCGAAATVTGTPTVQVHPRRIG